VSNILLWLDSAIVTDALGQDSLCRFLFEARQWAATHGCRMEGFTFGVNETPWWFGKPTPFKADALPNCRLWKLPIAASLTQDVATTTPYATLQTGRAGMDVSEAWLPGGAYPGWFVVFQTSTSRLVCLADECAQPA
jgi:hypothetical protein